ncbi:tetratricopeptide repeat protein [Kiloniella laminariae]|uniref:Tetratricopeptide repeat protein n=1 Tax=Kiloniella laminariae TaxID=454162 RepID=A0ABT4LNV5_9PROT|nr:tetratricopeptide repeat protein [Kiloniella laminariae]MCZ4282804.1 tetratricopeptide repeat protein [Kiloniella laminariae]
MTISLPSRSCSLAMLALLASLGLSSSAVAQTSDPSACALEIIEDAEQEMTLLGKGQKGDVCAANALGYYYYTQQNYPPALEWWGKAADLGHARAALELAMIHRDGLIPDPDLAEMNHRLQQGAELGQVHAQLELGLNYSEGSGIEKDLGQAMYWFEQAAKQGNPAAQYLLGWYYWTDERGMDDMQGPYASNDDKAAYWTCLSAQQDDPEAQYELSKAYSIGRGNLTADQDQRAAWRQKAADNGSEEALDEIAQLSSHTWYTKLERWGQSLFKPATEASCSDDPRVLQGE